MRVIRAGLLMLGASALAYCAIPIANAQSENTHWAYAAPRRLTVPVGEHSAWPENAIDSFTQEQMTRHGLSPSPEADRRTLIRRVTFDLTGLPPTPAEIDAFLADTAPGTYERLVDRLLQSPRFGERMATHWLDLARYADTHGYHMDAHRDVWRWRDWVIAAYNDNLPFDQFTIEQLAGDLLPDATLSQRIATGFNRNNMVNFENGVIADEFLSEYAIDRVTTTSTVWLGQTIVCARCHDHKYDPFTQRDFYRLLAFFNQAFRGVDAKVCDTARRRVLCGETVPNEDKLFSIFEPHTQLYKRGKAGEPVQFGRLLLVYEDAAGFLVHQHLMDRHAQDVDVPVEQTRALQLRLQNRIEEISFDCGFHSPENQTELAKIVPLVGLPKKGRHQAAEQEASATAAFRRARRRHAGVEAAIGALQAGNGLKRCRDKTELGFERYLALGVFGRNLHTLGKLLIAREHESANAACSKRQAA